MIRFTKTFISGSIMSVILCSGSITIQIALMMEHKKQNKFYPNAHWHQTSKSGFGYHTVYIHHTSLGLKVAPSMLVPARLRYLYKQISNHANNHINHRRLILHP